MMPHLINIFKADQLHFILQLGIGWHSWEGEFACIAQCSELCGVLATQLTATWGCTFLSIAILRVHFEKAPLPDLHGLDCQIEAHILRSRV